MASRGLIGHPFRLSLLLPAVALLLVALLAAPPAAGDEKADLKEQMRLDRETRSSDAGRRKEALRELGRKAGDFVGRARAEAARTFIRGLKDREFDVRRAALVAAGGNLALSEPLLPAVLEALLEPNRPERAGATPSYPLWEMGNDPVVMARARKLADEGPPGIRPVAAAFLAWRERKDGRAKEASPDAGLLPALVAGLSHPDPGVRRFVAAFAAGDPGCAAALAGSLPAAILDGDGEVRILALMAATSAGPAALPCRGAAVDLLDRGTPAERSAALGLLGAMGIPPAPAEVPVLARAPAAPPPPRGGPPPARPPPPPAAGGARAGAPHPGQLGVDDRQVRASVLLALAALGELPPLPPLPDADAERLLVAILDLRVREPGALEGFLEAHAMVFTEPAREFLTWFPEGAGVPKEQTDRAEGAWRFLEGRGAAAGGVILRLLAEGARPTRLRAAQALAALGSPDGETRLALLRGSLDLEVSVATACRRAIEKAAPGTVPDPEAVPPLVAAPPFAGRFHGKPILPLAESVEAALGWLGRHQSAKGGWDAARFSDRCTGERCTGPGSPAHGVGVTGLALLAFLGAGETHAGPNHAETVAAGLRYLLDVQDAEGCFGPRTDQRWVFDHAAATRAVAEAYGMTASPSLRRPAQNGISFIEQCQNPYLGWRYGVRPQDNDTAVTGWMTAALAAGRRAGLDVDPSLFEGARAWMDKVTEPEWGRAGYVARGTGPWRERALMARFPGDRSESLTALAVVTRLDGGASLDDEYVKKGLDLLVKCLPAWDEEAGTIDLHYWLWGSDANARAGGYHGKKWGETLLQAVRDGQCLDRSLHRYGSWDPLDPFAAEGGRVYSTAMATLALEAPWRAPGQEGKK